MKTVILIAAVFLLMMVVPSRGDGEGCGECDTAVYHREHRHPESRDRKHFINKHLHRNDEKHARHKQNQTPW